VMPVRIPAPFTPPVGAKRRSRYRGPVASENGTGVGSGNRTGADLTGASIQCVPFPLTTDF